MAHPLGGARAKLERAKSQTRALDISINPNAESHTIGIKPEIHLAEGYYCLRVSRIPIHPVEWSVIIGEIAHNLRCVLDYIVYELATLSLGRLPDERPFLSFPICLTENEWRTSAQGQIGQLTEPEHRARIQLFQPYQRGDQAPSHPLAILHNLNRYDKHRLLQTTALNLEEFTVASKEVTGFVITSIEQRAMGQILEVGTELVRVYGEWTGPEDQRQVRMETNMRVRVALPQWPRPVVQLLKELGDYIGGVIYRFQDLVS